MWEWINGEEIWIDKEMGYTEYERSDDSRVHEVHSHRCDCHHGSELGAGRIALGVAGGMIAAKAAPRIGGWLLWMGILFMVAMIVM